MIFLPLMMSKGGLWNPESRNGLLPSSGQSCRWEEVRWASRLAFMERGRRPRKRGDPKGRSVWDFTHNHEAAGADRLAQAWVFVFVRTTVATLNPITIAKMGPKKKKRTCRRDWPEEGSMKLVRHLDLKDRESDGAVHWESMGPKLRHAFQKRRIHLL